MRYIGILLVVCSFPFFYYALGSGATWRRWLIVALGALPIIGTGFNLDAAFVDWAGWPGHTKGLIISLSDTLALAVCLRYFKRQRKPVFLWIWLFYIVCSLPSLFVGVLLTPAVFYIISLLKAVLYFSACYVVMLRFGIDDLIKGLALAIIANGLVTVFNSVQGQAQTGGLIGHRNFAGMIFNMAIPTLLISGMQARSKVLPLLAVFLCAIAAALGGSRAVIILFGITVFATLLLTLLVKPTRQAKLVFSVCLLGSAAVAPLAISTLSDRFAGPGGGFTLEKDAERVAFEKAAQLMNEDHPLGVGGNQYAVTANQGGYSRAAGVNWMTMSKSAIVHNSYVLVRTEGGHIALFGMLVLLGSTLLMAVASVLRRRDNPARTYAVAIVVTMAVLILHLQFEWLFVTMVALYSLAFTTAVIAFVRETAKRAGQRKAAVPRARVPGPSAAHRPVLNSSMNSPPLFESPRDHRAAAE
jgi:hypothetical protein